MFAFFLQTVPVSAIVLIIGMLLPVCLLLLAVLMVVLMYNGLVRSRMRTSEAWSGITVQLKRRASLIPNLVESVRGYTQHEHEVFTEVAEARGALAKATGPAATAVADQALTQVLGRLMMVAENYPQLQAAGGFAQLREELTDTEEKIAYARQFYNANVLDYNTRIQAFPGNMVAGAFHFQTAEFFTAEQSVSEDIKVRFAKE